MDRVRNVISLVTNRLDTNRSSSFSSALFFLAFEINPLVRSMTNAIYGGALTAIAIGYGTLLLL